MSPFSGAASSFRLSDIASTTGTTGGRSLGQARCRTRGRNVVTVIESTPNGRRRSCSKWHQQSESAFHLTNGLYFRLYSIRRSDRVPDWAYGHVVLSTGFCAFYTLLTLMDTFAFRPVPVERIRQWLPGLFLGKSGEAFITSRDWHAGTSSSFCSLRISDILGMPNSGITLVHYIYYVAVDHANSICSLASSLTSTFVDVSCDVTTFQSSVWRLEEQSYKDNLVPLMSLSILPVL